MSLFRTRKQSHSIAESPSLLFRDLRRGPDIKFIWAHQERLLDDYNEKYLNNPNVALELPTGAGKTLVGLLVAEYRRRKHQIRVAYLCPTRQLCNQVKKHAENYGIACSLLIGPQRDYDSAAFAAYQMGEATAITTYNGIFNTNPRIDDPQVIICDDAHAGYSYISSLWTLRIRLRDYPNIFRSTVYSLWDFLNEDTQRRIQANLDSGENQPLPAFLTSSRWIDIVPAPKYFGNIDNLVNSLEVNCKGTDLSYQLEKISGHLSACNIYISKDEILIRPVIPPTLDHPPFANAKQRVFMSATLGEGGDLERIIGIHNISRIPLPAGWEKRGTGRRLVLFPDLLRTKSEKKEIIETVVTSPGKTLILVKENKTAEILADKFNGELVVFRAEDIEEDLSKFTKSGETSVLILANRYDGIDLPGDTCRKLIMVGLPIYSDLQEEFIYQRLGACSQFRDRIRTRITQGIGRCTRDENDYALVLLLGDDLLKWCCTRANIQGMHPELQAEMTFGMENSIDRSSKDFDLLINAFFKQGEDWADATEDIIKRRDDAQKQDDAVMEALKVSSVHEIKYMYSMWNGDFQEGYRCANEATVALSGGIELKPYRAFWHYMASASSYMASETTNDITYLSSSEDHIKCAIKSSMGVNSFWDVHGMLSPGKEITKLGIAVDPISIGRLLTEWKLVGKTFELKLGNARSSILSDKAKQFENGLATLGKMVGCESKSWNKDGAPDGLWIFSNGVAIVFEAKSDEDPKQPISIKRVRQAKTHKEWICSRKEISSSVIVHTIYISERTTIRKEAHDVADGIYYITSQEIRLMFERVGKALTVIRSRARNLSEEMLSELICVEYIKSMATNEDIIRALTSKTLKLLPISK